MSARSRGWALGCRRSGRSIGLNAFLNERTAYSARLTAQDARGCAHGHDADALFLDAVDAVVLAALEAIGNDPPARFRLFRELLAVARAQCVSSKPCSDTRTRE
jgi:hypothetical protein